ncbi:MAG: zinc ribbon domain-containing protein, partial [Candidatus Hydrogenedentes bacterium]|nr:zinc ribbon domain-containing protein [Candidatus Hydrogenedentota bacterium]
MNCSICWKLTDPSLENCPHCGSPNETGGSPASSSSEDVRDAKGDQCPSCGSPVQDGDIVCVRCGVNLLTGDQVAQKQEVETEDETNRTPYVVGTLAVVVVVLVAALAFVLLQDPIKDARQKARFGDILGAINILQKHTDTEEDDVDAFAMLGRLYWQAQQYPDASTAFDTASRLRASDEDLAFMAVLAAGKIPGDAAAGRQLSALKRMVANHPNNERAQKMLTLALGSAG